MNNKSKGKAFLKNTAIVTVGKVSGLVTMTVTAILTARYLGPEGKGQVALAMSTGMVLAQIFCLGFDQSAPYHIATGILTSKRVLGSWILAFVIACIFSYGVAYPLFARYLMNGVFAGVTKPMLFIGGLACPLYLLRLLVNSILHGHEEFFKQSYHNILICTGSIIGALSALVIFHLGPLGYVTTQIILGFASLAYGFFVLAQVIRGTPIFSLSDWFKMFRYGYKATLSQIFSLIDLRLDIYVVNYFTDVSLVGVYTVAAALGNMFWILPDSIAVVLFPRTAAADQEGSRKLTSLLCRNTMWQTIIAGGLFLLISRQVIIFVFGARFSDASTALAFLMPGVVGQVVSRICFTDCSARGFPEKATYSSAITAFLTVALDIYLIPKYGIYGAAVASSIAYCTSGILGLYWHLKLSDNTLAALIIPRKTDLKYYLAAFQKIKARFISQARD
ncbi:MAG: flippase [Phycisphaerae bacterium]|nr:flippase [Phycisphaerae bacterium]